MEIECKIEQKIMENSIFGTQNKTKKIKEIC